MKIQLWSLAVLCAATLSCSAPSPLCDVPGCEYSTAEWTRLQGLANLGEPPPDPSNKYVGHADAALLGQRFYFDTAFSGNASLIDTLARPVPFGRAPLGSPVAIACVTCHDPRRSGNDPTTFPGNVSMGAGLYDVNGQSTVNAAYYPLLYWNGRSDSLWSQAAAVTESNVSMNSTRLQVAWTLHDKYGPDSAAVFGHPALSGVAGTVADVKALLDASGVQCKLVSGVCPAECHVAVNANAPAVTYCMPRFPPTGKPGDGVCDPTKPAQAAGDAFDCMDAADRSTVTHDFANYSKALAAYEYKLVSRSSPFDQWVNAGPASTLLSNEAQRGARLFVGKAGCLECHSTPLLSDGAFHNVGVPQTGLGVPTTEACFQGAACDCVAGTNCLPWGAYDGLKKLQTVKAKGFRRDSPYSDDPTDASRAADYTRPLDDVLKGAWRTPSLRDAALTAPYMHNGVYQSLADVVWHYNQGGSASGFPGAKSPQMKPLFLTESEQSDLVAFLGTLTGAPLPDALLHAP